MAYDLTEEDFPCLEETTFPIFTPSPIVYHQPSQDIEALKHEFYNVCINNELFYQHKVSELQRQLNESLILIKNFSILTIDLKQQIIDLKKERNVL
jgi:hypothetical protein